MIFEVIVIACLACALFSALLFAWNLLLYREPPQATGPLPAVSVLIPARDEEHSIVAALEHVLTSRQVDFEVLVLDDASTDRTAERVAAIVSRDARVQLQQAPPLPAGWNGKQHACHVLASLARHPVFCFLDADVRIAPDALARMVAFLEQSRADLVSGFPQEETGTLLERLLLPLIHFILLGYLPLAGMRASSSAAFAAGCGQFLMARREAYAHSGGHAQIRTTMHDGLLLPALFRRHGLRTDLADMTRLARCRMYRSAAEVWRGLGKNATEGIAAPARIVPFTLLLGLGQVLPALLLPFAWHALQARTMLLIALAASWLVRFVSAVRFRQSLTGALLHPIGVAVLLVLQWQALVSKLAGKQAVWKHRSYNAG